MPKPVRAYVIQRALWIGLLVYMTILSAVVSYQYGYIYGVEQTTKIFLSFK